MVPDQNLDLLLSLHCFMYTYKHPNLSLSTTGSGWVGKTSYSLRTRPRRESCLCTPLCTRRGEHERRTAEATSPIRESSLMSSLIPTQVLVVPLLLVLVLLVVLYLRVPNGNTEEPAQTSLRSVSVLILDLRSSIPRGDNSSSLTLVQG